jgi:hypothetical protein
MRFVAIRIPGCRLLLHRILQGSNLLSGHDEVVVGHLQIVLIRNDRAVAHPSRHNVMRFDNRNALNNSAGFEFEVRESSQWLLDESDRGFAFRRNFRTTLLFMPGWFLALASAAATRLSVGHAVNLVLHPPQATHRADGAGAGVGGSCLAAGISFIAQLPL